MLGQKTREVCMMFDMICSRLASDPAQSRKSGGDRPPKDKVGKLEGVAVKLEVAR